MHDQNTLPPIPCMRPKKGLYNRHDRSSQSFINFLEQKITNKNIVYKLAKQGSKVYIIAMIGHYRDIYLYNDRVMAFK
jgi:hypothetical protein